jgi:pimeloyl-ACP methyl ester carboxylesterase
LAKSFDVIAPYAPGFGPAKDDLEKIAEGPLEITLHHFDLLDALDIDRANVVGISIGAWMAAELAAIYPDCVNKLVLVNPLGIWLDDAQGQDPFAQNPAEPTKILFSDEAMREQFLIGGHEMVDAIVGEMLNLRASAKFLWPIPDTGISSRMARVKAPTLVATSEYDAIVPSAHGPAWQTGIADAALVTIAGAGHLVELEKPQTFAALVKDFIVSDRVANVA